MDKGWIEKKIVELKNKICPEANIPLPARYEKSDVFTKTEAAVNLDRWKEKEFTILVYPAFFKLGKESERESVLAHEITHIKDVLSKDFGYDGSLRGYSGCDTLVNLENLIWELTIDMRLENDGYTIVQDYRDRINEYFSTHWGDYQTQFSLDLNAVKEIANSPTCSGIKELAKRKDGEWRTQLGSG